MSAPGAWRPRRPADTTPPGLYLHVPFCSAICPYCDFAVRVGRREKRKRFVETLLAEIALHAGTPFAGIDTVYFGGGTPSLLEAEDLERLLAAVRRTFAPDGETRIYLEANPEDVDAASLEAWRRLGVGFLSLGVQSFDDEELRFLGRRHDAAVARRSVELALAAEFATVSVDLIYGLPGQDPGAWRRNLQRATRLRPHHFSCYELVVHARTTFGKRRARGELGELGESEQADFFLLTHRFLDDAGYEGYEVSNFARGGEQRSRHNQKYWRHVPYLGLGPSAHSFDGRRRWWNERLLAPWERAVRAGRRPEADGEILSSSDLALEAVLLGMRTREGIDLPAFTQRFGVDLLAANRPLIERSIAAGLLRLEGDRLAPTRKGFAVADGLAGSFEVAGTARSGLRPPPARIAKGALMS